MNKKIILVFIVTLLIIFSIGLLYNNYYIVNDDLVFSKKDSVFVEKSNGLISYEEKVNKVFVGYEQVIVKSNVTKELWRVNPKNESESILMNVSVIEEVFVDSKTPIYVDSAPIGIKYKDFEVDFDDTKACVVCGTKLFCLSKSDGWSENRGMDYWCKNNEPVTRLGESYYIYDLIEQKELVRKTDVIMS